MILTLQLLAPASPKNVRCGWKCEVVTAGCIRFVGASGLMRRSMRPTTPSCSESRLGAVCFVSTVEAHVNSRGCGLGKEEGLVCRSCHNQRTESLLSWQLNNRWSDPDLSMIANYATNQQYSIPCCFSNDRSKSRCRRPKSRLQCPTWTRCHTSCKSCA